MFASIPDLLFSLIPFEGVDEALNDTQSRYDIKGL